MRGYTELLHLMGLSPDFDVECDGEYDTDDLEGALNDTDRGFLLDWDSVQRRVEAHSEEAKVLFDPDRLEEFPINMALMVYLDAVPVAVLRALLAAHPQAVTARTMHVACRNASTSGEVIEALLEHDPSLASASYDGDLPLHAAADRYGSSTEAARVLIRHYPAALGIGRGRTDRGHAHRGDYPIHLACRDLYNVNPSLVRLLIEEGGRRNVRGEHGAGGLFAKSRGDSPRSALELAIRSWENIARRYESHQGTTWSHGLKKVKENVWENLALCLRGAGAAKARQADLFDFPLLHAAISCGTADIVSQFMEDAKQDDDSLLEKLTEKDPLGRSPLGVALEHLDRFPGAKGRSELFSWLLSWDCGVQVAASVGAESARALYWLAAECGAAVNVLMNILRAHPALGTCRDAKSRLYPFVLLAATPMAEVDDVFELLVENPSLVEGGIQPSAQEAYLMKKLREKESKWKQERDGLLEEISQLKAKIARQHS